MASRHPVAFRAARSLSSGSDGKPGAYKNSIRPYTPDSVSSAGLYDRPTRDQQPCTHACGMAATFFLPIALIAGAISIGTVYWFNIPPYYVGLFQRCNNWTTICDSVSEFYKPNAFTDNESFESTWTIGVPLLLAGFAVSFIGFLSLVCYPCHRKVNCSKIACAIYILVAILLGFLLLASGIVVFILFAAKEEETYGWSFLAGCGCAGAAGLSFALFLAHVCMTCCED